MIPSLPHRLTIDGLRDYGVKGQIGLEKTLQEYLDKMLEVTAELKRVLKPTGTLWWNHGDSYSGSNCGSNDYRESDGLGAKPQKKYKGQKPGKQDIPEKSLLLQAHRLAIRMVDEQKWILRNTIIWHKPNVMPSSVKDRFTVDYEPIFFFTKAKKYWFETQYEPNQEISIKRAEYGLNQTNDKGAKMNAVNVQGLEKMGERFVSSLGHNKRSVWKIPTHGYSEAHFATFPEDLIVTPIKAGCPEMVCKKCGRTREKIQEPTEEYKKFLGKGWHDHKNDLGAGMGQQTRGFSSRKGNVKGIEKYKNLGYTNCGCNAGWDKGIVLDPFMGSGTTALVARSLGRNYLGIELNADYIKLAEKRLAQKVLF